ncbi:MAG: hypothetical protein QXR42_06780 [Candidatus Bathyarchaeia archaeon]
MVPLQEDCSLCGVTVPYYALSRCNRCKKLYCRNCLIYDEGKPTCLRCAKQKLMPATPKSKYGPLSQFLVRRAQYSNFVTLSFKFIEEILGDKLPDSAYINEKWWSNSLSHSASEAWLTVGWKVENVDLIGKKASFRKEALTLIGIQKKKQRRKPLSPAFKALALKRKPKKLSGPSKTKIAKTLARYKNIERQKAVPKPLKGKFKPKSAYEKKLYKPAEKPEQTA